MRFILAISLISTALCVPPVWYAPGGCGVSKYPDAGEYDLPARIVGGIEARPHEFPWQAHLSAPSGSNYFCGATIINERWVVTRAECVDNDPVASFRVVLGSTTLSNPDEEETVNMVEAIFIHELYEPEHFQFNIAVVKLAADVALNENVWPVCAPDSDFTYDWQKAAVSGWGALRYDGLSPIDILMYTTLNMTTNQLCQQIYGGSITSDMLCAGDNTGNQDRSPCSGDFGGPLVYKRPADGIFELTGVASWESGCALGFPAVFVRVTFFNDWISSIIEKN